MATHEMPPEMKERWRAVGQQLKRLGTPAQQATSLCGQASRSVVLSQRRSAFRARIAAIRYRVDDMAQEPLRQRLAERVERHARTDRYLRNSGLAVGVLAILAGLAFIATSGIGGAA